ncbi:Nuclear receptor 2C2-associated protein [Rhizoclosmatium sp. JEL0117]|nr:Nuclear receptor 2C2-associated protein [Rhizoclosmatium sp. JEL0117]
MSLLKNSTEFKVKVSSTLNKDSKSFGKQYLTDGSDETCWNSDQGTSQWIIIELPQPSSISHLHLMFQGGFTSSEVQVFAAPTGTLPSSSSEWIDVGSVYPEDSNKEQALALGEAGVGIKAQSVKIVFSKPGDTYGRIVLYKVDLVGTIVHIVGLVAIIIQQSFLYDFETLPFAEHFVSAYTITQLFIFGFTFQIRSLIPKAGAKEKPLVYAVHKTRVETNIEDYDQKESDDLLSAARIYFVVATLAHFQFKFLSGFSMLVLGILRCTTIATHPLFRIYILGAEATGDLERPWAPDEYLLKGDAATVKKVEETEGEKKEEKKAVAAEKETEVGAKKSRARKGKNKEWADY